MYKCKNEELEDVLRARVKAGVRIRFLIDGTENDTKKNMAKKVCLVCPLRHFLLTDNPRKKLADKYDNLVTLKFWTDKQKFHSKFAIVDGDILMTGSVNWSKNSIEDGHNIDNLLSLRESPEVADAQKAFEQLWDDKRAKKWDSASDAAFQAAKNEVDAV